MTTTEVRHELPVVARHAAVRAALADPRLQVPAAPPAPGGTPDNAWFRAGVARFANGEAHGRRRAYVVDRLAAVRADALRDAAYEAAATVLAARTTEAAADASAGIRVDVMADLARAVPLRVLAAALGFEAPDLDTVVDAVTRIAAAYHPGADEALVRDADTAVVVMTALVTALPDTGGEDGGDGGDGRADEAERIGNVIGILVQTCDATAGLIGNTAATVLRHGPGAFPGVPVAALVNETLRLDPPVRGTRRRVAAPLGLATTDTADEADATPEARELPVDTVVVLDFAAANRDPDVFPDPDAFDPSRGHTAHLTFGHGLRPCPGADHALALACGTLEPLLAGFRLAEPDAAIVYAPPANLRVPARLEVTPR
ncbi:cytochrome P450 [Yinghuangia seranimata]|uniref:cytochrome P450 n=1 Tax=Yinghuangia seranimata TaxID=408067 RepID=UPI00248B1D5E|nr:cytochrome P450 [Yinghuangia seranimata]MDI2131106.1 cytochrome P450 [Yinghuangia seranimata]